MYKELESVPNMPEEEKKVLAFWEKTKVLEQLKSLRKKSKEKVYYDGPITTNGLPHYGHAITWTMKDVIPRYWSMKNYFVERNMGWDTKGILVEYEVEKELKFTKKEDIKIFGEAKFIEYCRDFVERYKKKMFEYESKLGRWFDRSIIYSTADYSYVESIWWSLKELYEKGLLYEGHKVVAYSTRAGTTLSTHEVSEGGYKEIEDDFVTVKFKLTESANTYFLAWTTTPWTIPGNLLLAVNKKLDYIKVKVGEAFYIVAKDRLTHLFKANEFEIVESFKGSKLEGLEYEPPFNYFLAKRKDGCFKVILSNHATAEEGTGIVHLAPYGEEDFDIFMSLGIALFDYLDDSANFTDLVPEFNGLFYKDANPKIIDSLKNADALFAFGKITHRMPMCYRTGTPLIHKPIKSWYVAVTKLKEKMLKENQKINWLPEHLKNGNAAIWLENARDWALSRNRYWGTPLPVWINDKTQEKVFIGSFKELEKFSGTKISDPHRPVVDAITWADKKNGGVFRRVRDVIDVWYDSAVMPFARYHYPFKNKERVKVAIPADYISEGPDQVRLWFYVMHVLGMALFNKVPYKNVVTIGNMLDETGKKMSKSKRNYKPMDEVLDEYGADVLRYFILTSSIVSGSDTIFSVELLKNAKKDFFLTLWNSLKYFITYANVHKFKPNLNEKSTNVLDKWIVARMQDTVNQLSSHMDNYDIMASSKTLAPFVLELSTWYIRRSRDRIKDGDLSALNTLFKVLSDFTLMIAPFTPFLAETMYSVLKLSDISHLKSVHLNLYPKVKKLTAPAVKLIDDMTFVMQIVEKGHAERKASTIKVRQPLSKIEVTCSRETLSSDLIEIIKDELNVKEVKFKIEKSSELKVTLDTTLTKELEQEGSARELIRAIQALRKEKGTTLTEFVNVEYIDTEEMKDVMLKFEDYIKAKANVKSLKPGKVLKIL